MKDKTTAPGFVGGFFVDAAAADAKMSPCCYSVGAPKEAEYWPIASGYWKAF